ncbi:hypothetical protein SAMN05216520_11457 [Kandleria vitulina]|uniref:hypothetical protein n=1 Tax=Kandleria vitulina TaxID=1630 RepID=UPI0008875E07|nr:hypothetical protein [Kandleria vitulina]SDL83514.1 hypothetical protein SAMN05216520_11457 [Kandleria vitulina]
MNIYFDNYFLRFVTNTIRALLDLLDEGDFSNAQGMNEDFICNSIYDQEVFEKVSMLRNNDNWKEIDEFMGKVQEG